MRGGNLLKKYILVLLLTLLLSFSFFPVLQSSMVSANAEKLVYVIPVEQGIERGLESFLQKGFIEAEKNGADMIILEINTLGGAIDAALGIGELIQNEDIPVIAFIKGKALSAGAFISLSADKIYMEPSSHIGASAVRTITGDTVDPKITSVWKSYMKDAALSHHKNEKIAEGMVDPNVVIPDITKKGELITLSSDEALKYGIADGIVNTRSELIRKLGMGNTIITEVHLTPSEKLARFVTNPFVIPFLLIIGLAGIIIELFVPGFGVSGIIGISAFGLYFFGNYFAGFASWEALIFFLFGFILMAIELFVPGFGVFGIMGIISFITGIAMAAYETTYGLFSIAIAIVVNIILAIILVKYFGKKGLWNRFILKDEQKKETGYVSHIKDKKLIGLTGNSITKLRPSGTALIEGKRYDVITEGNFIDANKEIEVILVEGTRIVVKEVV